MYIYIYIYIFFFSGITALLCGILISLQLLCRCRFIRQSRKISFHKNQKMQREKQAPNPSRLKSPSYTQTTHITLQTRWLPNILGGQIRRQGEERCSAIVAQKILKRGSTPEYCCVSGKTYQVHVCGFVDSDVLILSKLQLFKGNKD